ncbi:MAG: helix-turn-helix domain-containing protein, partial [Ignisphaera sp.]
REEKFIIDRSSIPTAIPTSYYNHNAGNNLEMRIYHYILNKNGALDINECVKIFGITKDEVIKILKRLEEKGLIRIT